jgi:hypothetical protein
MLLPFQKVSLTPACQTNQLHHYQKLATNPTFCGRSLALTLILYGLPAKTTMYLIPWYG